MLQVPGRTAPAQPALAGGTGAPDAPVGRPGAQPCLPRSPFPSRSLSRSPSPFQLSLRAAGRNLCPRNPIPRPPPPRRHRQHGAESRYLTLSFSARRSSASLCSTWKIALASSSSRKLRSGPWGAALMAWLRGGRAAQSPAERAATAAWPSAAHAGTAGPRAATAQRPPLGTGPARQDSSSGATAAQPGGAGRGRAGQGGAGRRHRRRGRSRSRIRCWCWSGRSSRARVPPQRPPPGRVMR